MFFLCSKGTHADLLVVVFHKIITTGHQRLQPLFDCLLTILVNGESNSYFLFGELYIIFCKWEIHVLEGGHSRKS